VSGRLRLLLVSAGSVVGQKVLATLADRRERVVCIGTSSIASEPALFDLDRVYRVPPTLARPEAFAARLATIVDDEAPDLVVPCRDDDVLALAQLRDRFPALARRLLCGNHATAQVVSDKWDSFRFCSERALPFVDSIAAGDGRDVDGFVGTHGFPLVSKPRRGFSSIGIDIVFRRPQLDRALHDPARVVQAFLGEPRAVDELLAHIDGRGLPLFHTLQGLKHSIQALVSPDGDVVDVICTRNLRPQRNVKRVEPDDDPDSARIGHAIAAAFAHAGWRGPLNIQCQRGRDGIRVHEFNGRFTGATSDRFRLGFDEVGRAIECFTGVSIGAARGPVAREVFESMVARAADPRNVDALEGDGVWTGRGYVR
jgi:carbamoyl-phosphate synthase large subunit